MAGEIKKFKKVESEHYEKNTSQSYNWKPK